MKYLLGLFLSLWMVIAVPSGKNLYVIDTNTGTLNGAIINPSTPGQ